VNIELGDSGLEGSSGVNNIKIYRQIPDRQV